jgi:hypothetical protein
MRLIHHSQFRNPDGTPASKKGRARRALGMDWLTSLHSEDAAIQILADNLDDDYTLFCNTTLPNLAHDADMILIGPKGLWVFEFIYFEGLFKIDGYKLFIYSTREQRFKRCSPNPILQTTEDIEAFRKVIGPHFQQKEVRLPWVIPVVVAVNPKTHIQRTETVGITLLRGDQLYDYAAHTLKKFDDVLSDEDSEVIVNLLQDVTQTVKRAPEQKKLFHYRQKRIRGYSVAQWIVLLSIIGVNIFCFSSLIITLIYINSPIMQATLDGWFVRLRILLFR